MSAPPPLLSCQGLEAGYGASQVLFGIHLQIAAGEVVSLLGRNGMGKSTTIKALVGALRPTAGSIHFAGQPTARLPCDAIARLGLAIVPEGRHVFPNLTVREHLVAFADRRNGLSDVWDLERIYGVFPRLKERQHHLGSQLSGGEQQMLAIGRALIARPALMLLDEPSLGLSPKLTEDIFAIIARINAERGTSMLLVEQNATVALAVAHSGYIMEGGKIVIDGTAERLASDPDVREFYLGQAGSGEAKSFKDIKHYKRRKRWLS